jgi:hypothetical protein
MFRPAQAILRVVVIKYQVKLFKKSVYVKIDVKMGLVASCVVCLVWVSGVR